METGMSWIQILSAIGFGAIVTKLLDVVWLQRALRKSERDKWLRDQRLRSFSLLSKELISDGLSKGSDEIRLAKEIVAEVLLLLPKTHLRVEVKEFFEDVEKTKRKIDHFINNGSSTLEERAELREKEKIRLRDKAEYILNGLRTTLDE